MAEEIPEFISIERASRIVAPITLKSINGWAIIIYMLGKYDIRVRASCLPPPVPYDLDETPISKCWFAKIYRLQEAGAERLCEDWIKAFRDWAQSSLLVHRMDILSNLGCPSGAYHQPPEDTNAAGSDWSIAQILAWIATRDASKVAQIQFASHWEKKPDGLSALLSHNDHTRRSLIGWLQVATSIDHCRCGAKATIKTEAWEVCRCVGSAYDELREHLNGRFQVLPRFRVQPSSANFSFDWFEGAEEIRLARAEVLKRWPADNLKARAPISLASAQAECEKLLKELFTSAPKRQTKQQFQTQCQSKIQGLSAKAFNRAWGNAAPEDRTKPGAKRKS